MTNKVPHIHYIEWLSQSFCLKVSVRTSEFKSKLMDYIWTHLVKIEKKSDDEFHESSD